MTAPATARSLNQLAALVFGAVYVLVGLVGFMVDSSGFADTDGEKLLGIFEVNPLHNLAHIAIGLALLGASRTLASARATNSVVGGAYLLLGVLGLFILDSEVNILALNAADNGLHLASAALLLGVALGADKTVPAARV
jgi:hypothetical protein